MLIDIDKIIVKDRIRKDFGDIQELADDIRQNGLINPPVVNKEYELLAGERRLKACKSLGWNQIEVRMMDTRDAEHELNVEISENENRKEFSKSERVDYMKRLLRIEQAKAKERQDLGLKSDEGSRADEATAKQFNVGRDTMRKEISIVENKHLISDEDFADWDEGKLSTNKVFQKVRAELDKQKAENERLKDDNKVLAKRSEPKVIEKEVIKEVIPDDYENLKRKANEADTYKRLHNEMSEKWRKSEAKIVSLEKELNSPDEQHQRNLHLDATALCSGASNFLEKFGGYTYFMSEIDSLSATDKKNVMAAVTAIGRWADEMLNTTVSEVIE